MNRLALGTAQFGLDYGVSNRRGLIPKAEVFEVLKLAVENGIDTLDTAQVYGTSETLIGEFIRSSERGFKVVTKLKGIAGDDTDSALRDSLTKTGVPHFYGVMLHSFEEFTADRAGYGALLKAKEKNLTLKTGFSLYYPGQAEKLLSEKIPFDIVQVPYSLIDRRFERIFPALRQAGVEVHVRSVFLQGLLLMNPPDIPITLSEIKPKVKRLHEYAREKGVPVPALCAAYALSAPDVDKVVMGVDSVNNFAANLSGLKVFNGSLDVSEMKASLDNLSETNEKLILPQNWSGK